MAKVRTNNGGGDDKNKVPTKDYSNIYTKEQQRTMGNQFGGDKRTMAASMKEDIGNTKIKRAPYGSVAHQANVKQSMANTAKRAAENKAGTGTTPMNEKAKSAYIERTSTEATKLDKYTKTDNPTNGTTTTKKKVVYKGK